MGVLSARDLKQPGAGPDPLFEKMGVQAPRRGRLQLVPAGLGELVEPVPGNADDSLGFSRNTSVRLLQECRADQFFSRLRLGILLLPQKHQPARIRVAPFPGGKSDQTALAGAAVCGRADSLSYCADVRLRSVWRCDNPGRSLRNALCSGVHRSLVRARRAHIRSLGADGGLVAGIGQRWSACLHGQRAGEPSWNHSLYVALLLVPPANDLVRFGWSDVHASVVEAPSAAVDRSRHLSSMPRFRAYGTACTES